MYLHVEPGEAVISERPSLAKLQETAAEVGAHVVQVRMHGVRAAAEVQIVREVYRRMVLEVVRHLQSWQQTFQAWALCCWCFPALCTLMMSSMP